MGWCEITHADGTIESYGDKPPQDNRGAWDYPYSDTELFVPRNTQEPTPKALKTLFWYQVHFWGEGAYRRPVIKIQTDFKPST